MSSPVLLPGDPSLPKTPWWKRPSHFTGWQRHQALVVGALIVFSFCVLDTKLLMSTRWSRGWEVGLLVGVISVPFAVIPHLLFQWLLLWLLGKFKPLRFWSVVGLANLPVLILVMWSAWGRLPLVVPQLAFKKLVHEQIPASVRIRDCAGQKLALIDIGHPTYWGLHFDINEADFRALIASYYTELVPVEPEDEEWALFQHDRLKEMVRRSGVEFPFPPPYAIYRHTKGEMAELRNAVEEGKADRIFSDWADFLFRKEGVQEAFFCRAPMVTSSLKEKR